jgi:hypothetical protein
VYLADRKVDTRALPETFCRDQRGTRLNSEKPSLDARTREADTAKVQATPLGSWRHTKQAADQARTVQCCPAGSQGHGKSAELQRQMICCRRDQPTVGWC